MLVIVVVVVVKIVNWGHVTMTVDSKFVAVTVVNVLVWY